MKCFNREKMCPLLVMLLVVISSCYHETEKAKAVIQKAGSNAHALQEVLDYYKNRKERQKFKAALYLIENMEQKYGHYFADSSCYYAILSQVDSLKDIDPTQEHVDELILKELDKHRPHFSKADLKSKKMDYSIITSDYLIDNIEHAFMVWKNMPYASHIDFETFCEWILPYRIYHEPLQDWREFFFDQLSWVADSMENVAHVEEAAKLVNDFIAKEYQFSDKLGFLPDIGPLEAWKYKAGTCHHRYALIVMAMRSIGIPAGIDFTTHFSAGYGNHAWATLLTDNGKVKTFNGGEEDINIYYPAICPIDYEYVANVYRRTFAIHDNELLRNLEIDNVPIEFRNPQMKLVTKEYGGLLTADVEVQFKQHGQSKEYGYLMAFDYGVNMSPIAFARLEDNRAAFKNIGRKGLYIGSIYDKGKFGYTTDPFILPADSGEIEYLRPDMKNLRQVKLYRKFGIKYTMKPFVKAALGAKMQGSNRKDFSDSVTLHTIDTVFDYFKFFRLKSQEPYRYYRYLSSDSGDIRLAEIQFYQSTTSGRKEKINGEIYGYISDSRTSDDTIYTNINDNDLSTNFNAPAGSWIALDAGRPVTNISARIMVRNNLNVVEPGQLYELLYYNDGWYSAGKKVAMDYFIEYDNIPGNTILLLKNHTQGKEERIFLYDNGQQNWW